MLKPRWHSYNTVEDFVADEDFQNYCLHGENERRWVKYRKKFPGKIEVMDEAAIFVQLLSPPSSPNVTKNKKRNSKKWLIAAIVLPLLMAVGTWMATPNQTQVSPMTSHAAVDQNMSILLSDLSKINLREGSDVSFRSQWNPDENKEVWLKGEAYFDVEKSRDKNQKFVVHLETGNINVLGTKFVVKSDLESTTIVLEEGIINYDQNGATYEMYPGDMLKSTSDGVQVLHNNDVRTFDSWRSSKLAFSNKSIEDVLTTINRSYGLNAIIGNPSLRNRKITATVNRNDPMLLLQAIAEIYNIEVVKTSNQIILK